MKEEILYPCRPILVACEGNNFVLRLDLSRWFHMLLSADHYTFPCN
uniref:Uncharacterized protein n=1 Tax=Arundo donax TaxID=35708 RepID=A0A0A9C8E2_ARUDO